MSFLVFTDQAENTRESIRRIHENRHKTVIANSFLDKVYYALRDEVWSLHQDTRDVIPSFNSVFDLSERHTAANVQRLEVSSALLCISQLANFIFHHEHNIEQSPSIDNYIVVGTGLGQLCAAAIACAATIVDLPDIAVEAVRLAFRIGSMVETVSLNNERYDPLNATWRIVVPSTFEQIQEEIQIVQDSANVPTVGRAVVTAIDESTCTVSGSPARLAWLEQSSKLLASAKIQRIPGLGVWHASNLYSADRVNEIVKSRYNRLSQINAPRQQIIAGSTGGKSKGETALDVFTEAVNGVLRLPIHWSAILSTMVDSIAELGTTTTQLFVFEQCDRIEHLKTSVESKTMLPVTSQVLEISTSAGILSDGSKAPSPAIAIVGMSGRFPGAPDVDQMWDLLVQGKAMHRKIPKDRFDVETHYDPEGKKNNSSHTPYGCFIEEPGLFDPRFFSMSPREATQTDPMHRLALVTAYEALEMSGFVLNSTPSSQQDRVGTFYGQTSDDWREVNAAQNIETYFIPGGVRAFAPGRISYHFGFRGPSYSVDTACSSSLAAIQIACSSIRSGECDTAVAGGVNILTAPDIFAGLSKGQFLSKTGACKTWDSKADGYCRADGVGSIVLKRLDDAVADKNNILGVILSTATNHSADAISITHPHAGNQSYLYESVLHDAGVSPLDVSYVEMHGTGTQAGDMTEMRSVSDVFAPEGARGTSVDKALHIGAVKSNIGHGEAAAGIGALIKILLMLRNSVIPRHIGIQHELNPGFPALDSRNMRIPFENIPWSSGGSRPRTAFLNNFSAAGGNTAMLIQEGPNKRLADLELDPRESFPFVISARSISSLKKNVERLLSRLETIPENLFSSLSYTLTARRTHHNIRIGVVAASPSELRSSLQREVQKDSFAPTPSASRKVVFVFTGQGAYYGGIAKSLFDHSTQFRSTILELDQISKAQGFPSFLPALEEITENPVSSLVEQLALVCVQIALVQLWRSWGIKPSLVIGHSLGEYAALYAAGVLSVADTVYLVGVRARLLEAECERGTYAMLAVRASVEDIKLAVGNLPFNIACLNSPTDTVLSGTTEQVDALSRSLKQEGLQCTVLGLSYAFHSAQIDPILSRFKELAGSILFQKPAVPVISPLLEEVIDSRDIIDASYLCRHAREVVNFVGALENAASTDYITDKTIFVEIGPRPICSKMVKSTFSSAISTVASLEKGENSWKSLSNAVCSLHCAGIAVDFREFHRDFESCHDLLDLPSYSFDNKNYWIDYVNDWCLHKVEPRGAKSDGNGQLAFRSKLSTSSIHRITSETFENDRCHITAQSDLMDPVLFAAVQGHQVNNTSLFSSSIYADMALTLGDYLYKEMRPEKSGIGVNCGNMEVFKPLILKKTDVEARVLEVTVDADLAAGEAKVQYQTIDTTSKQSTLHATCVVTFENTASWEANWNKVSYLIEGRMDLLKEKLAVNKADKMSRKLLYRQFSALVDYKTPYQGMEEVIIDGSNFEATSRVVFQTEDKDGHFFCSPFWIDSLMHLGGFVLNGGSTIDTKDFVYISHGWKALRFATTLERSKTYHSYVRMQNTGEGNVMAGDVYVFDNGTIVATCVGLRFQRIPRKVLNTFLPPQPLTASTEKAVRPTMSTEKSAPVAKKSFNAAQVEKLKDFSVDPVLSTTAKVMNVISVESELPLSELQDDCNFANIGIDSLLSLQILGKLRETLDLDLPGHIFIECESIGQLKRYLETISQSSTDDESLSSSVSVSSQSTVETTPSVSTDAAEIFDKSTISASLAQMNAISRQTNANSHGESLLQLFRETISEQMGIAIEEVVGSNDLVSMGMDSLMSICILGIIREKTEMDLPSDFFLNHNSMEDIARFLSPALVESPDQILQKSKASRNSKTKTSKAVVLPTPSLPRAVSILIQGKPRTAAKTLFLLPDGSGSATSYTSIPAVDPSVAVYGLNSPYMKTPSQFTNGIPGIASQYLEEIRRRQPTGPYHLGGWSAGGVVAYEITLQILAAGEMVESLLLLDSPCPIALEPLPSRLHHFFAEIGLLGSDNGTKIPDWLLPHFESSIKALTAYKPQSIPTKYSAKVPRTLAVWARYGVCRYPDSPRPEVRGDEPRSMNWLLNNRTDFGPNGWENLLGNGSIETTSLEGNHFTLMKDGSQLVELADLIRKFMVV